MQFIRYWPSPVVSLNSPPEISTVPCSHCTAVVLASKLPPAIATLPEDLLQKYIEKTIRIPMREHLRSLNLSNSVAIVAYEILRQVGFDKLEQISSYFDKK